MELYHMLNRGVDKRHVFLDDGDYLRFTSDLYELNNKDIVANPMTRGRKEPVEKPLVQIHAWCLMPNHYHLLVSPVDDDLTNLSEFARKMNMGYSKFFNEKYERAGALWQGKYKKIHIVRDAHYQYIPHYIHMNPLDLFAPTWRTGEVRRPRRAIEKLQKYRWSSNRDYLGIKNFPSIIRGSELSGILGSRSRQERMMRDIMSNSNLGTDAEIIEI